MAKLIITRPDLYVNRFRNIQIWADGKLLGEIANHDTKSFELSSGRHSIMAKIDWCKTKPLDIHMDDQSEIKLLLDVPNKMAKDNIWLSIIRLGLLFGGIYMSKILHREMIFWIAAGIIVAWYLYDFLIRKNKPVLYYLLFARDQYIQLNLQA